MLLGRNYDPAIITGGKWLLSDIVGGGFSIYGNTWYVNGTTGANANEGSQAFPFGTITYALAQASAGDTIIIGPGTYSEAVTVSLAGVRLIGAGTSVKRVVWTSGTDTTSCAITAQSVEIAGIYFKVPVESANAASASISLSNASYAYIHDNRFQGQTGSFNAIYSAVENSDNVTIANNDFEYLNTASNGAAILTLAAGGLSYSDWMIINNKFSSCVKCIVLAGARVAGIFRNHIGYAGITAAGVEGNVMTSGIVLSGTSSGANMVHGNYLGGTYTNGGGYTAGTAGDDWAGNFNIAGITAANPAP